MNIPAIAGPPRGILRVLAMLPLSWLYAISALLLLIVEHLLRVRLDTVRDNIQRCFPQLTAAQVQAIANGHYAGVAQMLAETIKAATLSPQALRERVVLRNAALAQGPLAAGQPLLIIAAHQCNWEWILHGLSLQLGYPLEVAYKPLRSAWAERGMFAIRSRFGSRLVPAKELLPSILRRKDEVRAIAMLADQEPVSSDRKHWVKFLGRDTAFYMGPEEIARSTRYPALFVAMRRRARGFYELEFLPLASPEEALPQGEFTARYARLVEQEIRSAPADWTWSHRRWKLKKPFYRRS